MFMDISQLFHMPGLLLLILGVLLLLALFCHWQNNDLVISRFAYRSGKVPQALHGLRIVHLSDLHNKDYHGRLIKQIRLQQPDIIVITGDLIDRRRTDLATARRFVAAIVPLAPVYYVSGNHEVWSGRYAEVTAMLKEQGAIVLDDTALTPVEGLNLLGLSDPARKTYATAQQQTALLCRAQMLNVLLAHRPGQLAEYAAGGADLVLAGHAHGGQVRLPLIGALYAPHQGLLPKYTSGRYTLGQTTMIVSRGLGNSLFPLRIFNRPEIVVISLEQAEN